MLHGQIGAGILFKNPNVLGDGAGILLIIPFEIFEKCG